jgi:hypothetical protein
MFRFCGEVVVLVWIVCDIVEFLIAVLIVDVAEALAGDGVVPWAAELGDGVVGPIGLRVI